MGDKQVDAGLSKIQRHVIFNSALLLINVATGWSALYVGFFAYLAITLNIPGVVLGVLALRALSQNPNEVMSLQDIRIGHCRNLLVTSAVFYSFQCISVACFVPWMFHGMFVIGVINVFSSFFAMISCSVLSIQVGNLYVHIRYRRPSSYCGPELCNAPGMCCSSYDVDMQRRHQEILAEAVAEENAGFTGDYRQNGEGRQHAELSQVPMQYFKSASRILLVNWILLVGNFALGWTLTFFSGFSTYLAIVLVFPGALIAQNSINHLPGSGADGGVVTRTWRLRDRLIHARNLLIAGAVLFGFSLFMCFWAVPMVFLVYHNRYIDWSTGERDTSYDAIPPLSVALLFLNFFQMIASALLSVQIGNMYAIAFRVRNLEPSCGPPLCEPTVCCTTMQPGCCCPETCCFPDTCCGPISKTVQAGYELRNLDQNHLPAGRVSNLQSSIPVVVAEVVVERHSDSGDSTPPKSKQGFPLLNAVVVGYGASASNDEQAQQV